MQEKKKILFCITKGNFGGAQRYVFDLATHMSKTVFDIVVACGQGGLLIERLKEANIRTIEIEGLEREIKTEKDFEVLKNLIKIIREEKPNIVHFNSSKIGFLGSLAVLFLKLSSIIHNSKFIIRSIFTSHGWAFNEQNRSTFSKIIFYIAHYFTVLVCDTTIAVSEKTKNDITWLPFIKDKIKIVHNGIEKFKTLSKKEAAEILVKKDKKETVILTLAELHHNKGIDVALQGISLLPQNVKERINYYIAGNGEERENLEKLADDLKIKNTVHFLGFMADAKKLLSGADIFLLPSRTENLPYAVLEAGFLGVPVIATSVGGIPEIIRDMQNGILVYPKNPKEIAEAIMYMLDHKDKQKEFGSEIKKTVTNFFSLEKMLKETIELYR